MVAAARSVTPSGGEFVAVEGTSGHVQELLDVFASVNGGDAAPLTAGELAGRREELAG
jgi:hypothetical protein